MRIILVGPTTPHSLPSEFLQRLAARSDLQLVLADRADLSGRVATRRSVTADDIAAAARFLVEDGMLLHSLGRSPAGDPAFIRVVALWEVATLGYYLSETDLPWVAERSCRLLVEGICAAEPFPRSVTEIGRAVGCSTRTIRRHCSDSSVHPRQAMAYARLARAVWLRGGGERWDHVAMRMGFSGLPGLCELSRRRAGVALRALPRRWGVLLGKVAAAVGAPADA